MRNFCSGCGLVTSYALIVFGLFCLFVFPFVSQFFAAKEIHLSPNSKSFAHWRKTPIPVHYDFYLFNWTNPEELGKTKPVFVEMGPYRFYENREKVNLTWNDNGTITYRQVRSWHFSQNESTGSLSDMVTTINAVGLTAAHSVRQGSFLEKQQVNFGLRTQNHKLAVTHTIRDLLFDGYDDNLIYIAYMLPHFSPIASPYDKFAWFYKRNNSYEFDGWFNLDTGAKDISQLGQIRSWNHKNHTGFYPGECGKVRGFSGDMFPPGYIKKDSRFNLYSQDLCGVLPFEYNHETEVRDISGYTFTAKLKEKFDGTKDKERSCYCNGECVPSGFLNLTSCRYGAPVFVSFPHFYDANPTYLNMVEGLRPERERHEFRVTVEPTYGIPIDVKARVQLNMMIHPISGISLYRKVPQMMIPVLWVDQRARITEPLAQELRRVVMIPLIATILGVFALSLGTLLFLGSLVHRARSRLADKKMVKQAEALSKSMVQRKSLTLSTIKLTP